MTEKGEVGDYFVREDEAGDHFVSWKNPNHKIKHMKISVEYHKTGEGPPLKSVFIGCGCGKCERGWN